MSLIDKAKEISGQAVEKVGEKVGELGGDDLIVNTIIRVAEKRDRINQLLKEKGCLYHIDGIEVENSIPPKVAFSVSPIPEYCGGYFYVPAFWQCEKSQSSRITFIPNCWQKGV